MSRLIDADALIKSIKECIEVKDANYEWEQVQGLECALMCIEEQPTITPERKRGRWLEKKVVHATNDGRITEWQSCKCSECGRYDTRPYLYYFDEPNFCSWCGAEMREGEKKE